MKYAAAVDVVEKMRRDWDRRARVDPRYWVAATAEADIASYEASAERDATALLDGLDEHVTPIARVLDLGCGIGRIAARIAPRYKEVVGVDISPEMIEVGRQLHADVPNLDLRTNSGVDLRQFTDGRFEFVFSYSVLPHLPPDVVEVYFAEVNRVLSPNGWFRFQFWIRPDGAETAPDVCANDSLSIRVYDEASFRRLHEHYGFEIVARRRIDYFDPVLKLHPVWVDARKIGAPIAAPAVIAPRDVTQSVEERDLEYGLLLYLAVKAGERGCADEAERVLEEAVASDPQRPEAYVQWAAHRLDRDDVRGAMTLFDALTERAPDCQLAWLYRAQTAELLDDTAVFHACLEHLTGLAHLEPHIEPRVAEMQARLSPGKTRRRKVRRRRR